MNANVINSLNEILADSIVLYQKLHHFHWRVQGRGFFQLHAKFEEMYNHFAGVSDEVAERILMIGGEPLASLKQALEISSVKESNAVPAASDMVIELRSELNSFRSKIRSAVDQAEEAGDRGSVGLLDPIADALDKEIWMLDAFLAE
jgi:starvation-inducible DNA-binding protein|nr:DNA starvation/stationary phase protection protein [Candidatus Krumholzibacteria bacterium]